MWQGFDCRPEYQFYFLVQVFAAKLEFYRMSCYLKVTWKALLSFQVVSKRSSA